MHQWASWRQSASPRCPSIFLASWILQYFLSRDKFMSSTSSELRCSSLRDEMSLWKTNLLNMCGFRGMCIFLGETEKSFWNVHESTVTLGQTPASQVFVCSAPLWKQSLTVNRAKRVQGPGVSSGATQVSPPSLARSLPSPYTHLCPVSWLEAQQQISTDFGIAQTSKQTHLSPLAKECNSLLK